MEKAAPASRAFIDSTIGKKVVMAVTGIVLVGFVVGHMIGNLQVYLGPEALNEYSVSLHALFHGAGLWIARGGLLLAVVLHIWAAASLWGQNKGARQHRYKMFSPRASTYASRTMYWSGPILLLFIVYHLLHFTFGTVHPDFREGDVYRNFVVGFQQPAVSAFYILAMLALGLHLYHGVWSLLHTLGLAHPRWNAARHSLATFVAAAVVIGNISFPVAVLTGFVK
jgi:succinate dehydrogenase / fumarate reductase cytochrome b subunit